ncbi:MAG: hypothetical protein V2I43_16960 [Parvularcula sp.]|nr:hypothetical protein [Parvularcula sp.]
MAVFSALMVGFWLQAAPVVETDPEDLLLGGGGPWRGMEADLRALFFLRQSGIDLGEPCRLVIRPDFIEEGPSSEVNVRTWSTPGSTYGVRSAERSILPEAARIDCLTELERRNPAAFDRLMLTPRPDLRPLSGEAGLESQLLGGPGTATVVVDPTQEGEPTVSRVVVKPR